MKVKCTDNKGFERITTGKEYNLVGVMIQIIDDYGCRCTLDGSRFEVISEVEERKLLIDPKVILNNLIRL